ncbi:ATP-binding cassette domain-containing protein [Listeria innocua]|uniref:ATP-binding cassette domain-containing protein n=1 Tax=Listeria innocua TaxID=1642 RepID=UPI0005ED82AB|nr:ATP-binding cassette domain-containing protein [Listeria innocua]EHF3591068.1 ATP-binding cassette domain-containing protein [Listeria innocua]EHF3592765.1 ATP-binding cassette domain-containing protein [Listeria innocua]EHF3607838.1 ATP-binding cassette domain-containing protein [Listeria innocua]EHM7936458.1 ATP-binding cassette domain-containing protein [Listeria innocua]EHR9820918.1 ATP-binding cassette domain-containing protein [Listeria innocua]
MKDLKEEEVLSVIKIILSEKNQKIDVMKNIFMPFNQNKLEEYFQQFYIKTCVETFSFNKMKSDKLNILITKENEIMIISSFDENSFITDNQKDRKRRSWKEYEFKSILNIIDIQIDNLSKAKKVFIFKDLHQQMKPNRLLLINICILMFVSFALVIAMSFYLEVIFDLVLVNYLFSYLWPITFFSLFIMFLLYSLQICIEKLVQKYISRIVYRRKNKLLGEIKRKVKNEFLPRIVIFLNDIPVYIFSITIKWLASLPLLFLGILLFRYDTNMFILCLLMGILNILIGVGLSSRTKNKYKSLIIQRVSCLNNEKENIFSFSKEEKVNLNGKGFNEILLPNPIFRFFLGISTLVIFTYLIRMILLDIISVGILFIYLAIALSFLLPFILFGKLYVAGSIYEGYLEIYNSLYRYGKYKEIIFWDNKRISKLRLQNVKFPNYTTSTITNIQFDFGKSELIAIESKNSSGKTYLSNILTNNIRVPAYTVLYDEVDVEKLSDSKEFDKKIVLLNSCEELNCDATILDNITQGENYSEQDIYDACQEACILNFINNLPNKFHTVINSANQFSATEKKLIRLASTLLNEAEVIVFDSFFDNFEPNDERNILGNLKKVPGVKFILSKKTINADLFDSKFLLINGTLQKSEGVSNL